VGAFVVDNDGKYFGLTARHILQADASAAVHEVDSRKAVGERFDLPMNADLSRRPFYETIGIFRIADQITNLRMRTSYVWVRGVCAHEAVVGQKVHKVEMSPAMPCGEVKAVGGAIRFNDPISGESTIFRDSVEVRFDDEVANPVGPGEAGSLVLDEQDNALGLITGGTRERCFVAPLWPFLQRHGFELTKSHEEIDPLAHNLGEQGYRLIVSDLPLIGAAGRRMRDELRAEGATHTDAEEEVPQDLQKLLSQGQ
jgi:hypothetical protein